MKLLAEREINYVFQKMFYFVLSFVFDVFVVWTNVV